MRTLTLPEHWTGSAEQVNALPADLREWVMWLETDADPAGTVRENWRLTQENRALRLLLALAPSE